MGYVTNADVEERLGHSTYVQLTDDAGTGQPDADKVDEARLAAEGEADSYLARRVAVPVDLGRYPELAGVLKGMVLDLIAYRLYGRRPPVSPDVKRRRDEAIQWLERVAAGEVALPSSTTPAPNAATGLTAATVGPPRSLTRETMREL